MSDESAPRPMANMLAAANEGQTTIQMSPEEFVYLERDCETFKIAIRQIQRLADEIGDQDHWGLGEANNDLYSARAMVGRYKVKAKGAEDGNSVHLIMEQHFKIAEDIQNVFRIMRDQMVQADSEWAAAFNSLNASLPERPPVEPTPGPHILPDGSTR